MNRTGRQASFAVAALLATACGTIGATKEGEGGWLSGPKLDLEILGEINSEVKESRAKPESCCLYPVFVLWVVDIPVSFVADSIWWGIVDPLSHWGGSDESPAPMPRNGPVVPTEPTYPITGGCGDLLAYAATADRLEYVVVQFDRAKFDLTDGRAVHDLSVTDPSIEVRIDRYSVAPDEPYCTDVEPPPGSEHRFSHAMAKRGRLRIIALDPLPGLYSGTGYRVRVRLEHVEFVDVNGAVTSREAIEFESTVGWMPG